VFVAAVLFLFDLVSVLTYETRAFASKEFPWTQIQTMRRRVEGRSLSERFAGLSLDCLLDAWVSFLAFSFVCFPHPPSQSECPQQQCVLVLYASAPSFMSRCL
jgi:hypothetical protein